jgi:hypothetical protein
MPETCCSVKKKKKSTLLYDHTSKYDDNSKCLGKFKGIFRAIQSYKRNLERGRSLNEKTE